MHENTEHAHAESSTRSIFVVWFSLLALTAIEVFLGYRQLELKLMLGILMGLSLVKASLIIAYFMHLRYERRSLLLTSNRSVGEWGTVFGEPRASWCLLF